MDLQNKIQDIYKTSKNYPELVKALIGIGVVSYTADVYTGIILYRFADGVTSLHAEQASRKIEELFNEEQTVQAIRDNQQGKTTYPEFMEGIAQAGVRFYEATLSGNNKRVTYIGSGGSYEEVIPQ